MEIGFALPAGSGIEARVRLDFARELERAGYESFWCPHYVSRDAHGFDALNMLTAVAAVTERIKLGTNVLQVPLYQPVELARRVVTLDHLSSGRFILGVGIGWIPKEFENCGVPYRERAGRANEALAIMKKLWTEEEVTYQGKYYSLREVVLEPKPVQKPHPKVLVGGVYHRERRGAPGTRPYPEWSPGAIRRVVEFGDGWIPGGSVLVPEAGSEVLAEGMERIRQAAGQLGRKIRDDEFEISLTSYGEINIDGDRERAEAEAAKFYARRERKGFYQVQGNPSFESLKVTGRFGPPEEVAKLIRRWQGFKRKAPALKRLIIMFASVEPLEQLERFHTQVAPLLR